MVMSVCHCDCLSVDTLLNQHITMLTEDLIAVIWNLTNCHHLSGQMCFSPDNLGGGGYKQTCTIIAS